MSISSVSVTAAGAAPDQRTSAATAAASSTTTTIATMRAPPSRRRRLRCRPDRAPGSTNWSDGRRLRIQRLVAPEDAVFVEGNAAVAGEIGLDVRPRGDAVVQIDQARDLALERLHAFWKGVAQPFDDLEQRQIDIGQPAAGEIGAAIASAAAARNIRDISARARSRIPRCAFSPAPSGPRSRATAPSG